MNVRAIVFAILLAATAFYVGQCSATPWCPGKIVDGICHQ